MQDPLARLLIRVRACRVCEPDLPCGPRPVLQAGRKARLRIIGQAPGRKVHETGVPWDDASGRRLREWLGITAAQFYDPQETALIPMGFCYPGRGTSGDNPPRPECAPLWHAKLDALMPDIGLNILVGHYAQNHYLAGRRKANLGETVRAWAEYLPTGWLPLPHPSPRNQPWLARNPWFEAELLPHLQKTIRALGF